MHTLQEKIAAIAAQLENQDHEPWPEGSDSDRLHFWRDRCITTARALRIAVASEGEPVTPESEPACVGKLELRVDALTDMVARMLTIMETQYSQKKADILRELKDATPVMIRASKSWQI